MTQENKQALPRVPRMKPDGGYDWYEFDRWLQRIQRLLGAGSGNITNLFKSTTTAGIPGQDGEDGEDGYAYPPIQGPMGPEGKPGRFGMDGQDGEENLMMTPPGVDREILRAYFDSLYVSVTGGYRYAAALADDATVALPTITANYAGHGFVAVSASGVIAESAEFEIDSTGTCQIIRGTANMVVNADTDLKFCLGTAAAQNPMSFKNRLGASKNVLITLWYG